MAETCFCFFYWLILGTKLFFIWKMQGTAHHQTCEPCEGGEQESINIKNQALLNNQKNLIQAIFMRSQSDTNDNMLSISYLTCRLLVKQCLNILCRLEWLTLSRMANKQNKMTYTLLVKLWLNILRRLKWLALSKMTNKQNKMTKYLHRMAEWLHRIAKCLIEWLSIYIEWLSV
jgi:hypothetical protein